MFTQDMYNNVGRYCSVRGVSKKNRDCRVFRAMTNYRYMVVCEGKHLVVNQKDMTNLY